VSEEGVQKVSNSQYDNSGGLNANTDKRSDKSPDFWGSLQISGEVLEALKEGKKIRLSGWNRTGRYGDFISLKAELERPRDAPQKQARDQVPGQYDMKAAEALARTSSATDNHEAALTTDFNDDIPF
jgi:hypothetical protein